MGDGGEKRDRKRRGRRRPAVCGWAGCVLFFSRRRVRFVRQAPQLASCSLARGNSHASVDPRHHGSASHHSRKLNVHATSGSCSASSPSMIFTTLAFQLLLLGLAGLPLVSGNVEKEIFVAPRANDGQYLELEALHLSLPRVNPSSLCGTSPCRSLKTTLNTSFLDGGERQWVLLDHLKPGKRYEVRICWAATVSLHPHQAYLSALAEFHKIYCSTIRKFSHQQISSSTSIHLISFFRTPRSSLA